MPSISRFIITLIVVVMVIGNFYASYSGYRKGLAAAELMLDETIQEHQQLLLRQLNAHYDISPNQFADNVIFQIGSADAMRFQSNNVVQDTFLTDVAGFSFLSQQGSRWRVLRLDRDDYSMLVGQRYDTYINLLDDLLISAVTPLLWIVPFLAVVVWLIVRLGLSPLRSIAAQLHHRQAIDFSPVYLEKNQQSAELMVVSTSLNSLLARLEEAFKREQRFASYAAHELRSPLTTMKLSLHNLVKQEAIPENDSSLHSLQDNMQRMQVMIEQLLILSKLGDNSARALMGDVDIVVVLRNVIAALYPRIEDKQQTIALEGSDRALIRGSEFVLNSALNNVIENAVKYTPPGGMIFIHVALIKGFVNVTIADSGPGLSDTDIDKVFDRFYRVGGDRHQSKEQGSGLGLSIVWQCMQIQNADITLGRSDRLGGLSVTMRFPRDQEQCG